MGGKSAKDQPESQSDKFKRAARELGADESDEEALKHALRKMRRPSKQRDKEDEAPPRSA